MNSLFSRPTALFLKPTTMNVVLRWGAALTLMAVSLLSLQPVVRAQPLIPSVPEGEVHHACPDTYEVDDVMSSTVPTLLANVPQSRSFDGDLSQGIADKDFARLAVVRTGVYTITTSNLSPQADTVLTLMDAQGQTITTNDDSGAPDHSSQIVWTAPENAAPWYYVKVTYNVANSTNYACATVNTVVSYTLNLDSREPLFLYLPLIMR